MQNSTLDCAKCIKWTLEVTKCTLECIKYTECTAPVILPERVPNIYVRGDGKRYKYQHKFISALVFEQVTTN